MLTSWWSLVIYTVNFRSFSNELWYYLNVWSDKISRNSIHSLPFWLGELGGRSLGGSRLAHWALPPSPLEPALWAPVPFSCFPGAKCPAESDSSLSPRPGGTLVAETFSHFSTWPACPEGKSRWMHICTPGPQGLARRQFLSSQDFSEVKLNLEKEGLKTFIYVFLVE